MRARFDDYERDYKSFHPRSLLGFEPKLTLGALGLAGEAGEFADLVKKVFYHGHSLDREKMILELGDILWYLTYSAEQIGSTLEEIADRNVDKLHDRYPQGFSQERSINREARKD